MIDPLLIGEAQARAREYRDTAARVGLAWGRVVEQIRENPPATATDCPVCGATYSELLRRLTAYGDAQAAGLQATQTALQAALAALAESVGVRHGHGGRRRG